ncbi:MAG: sigma-70 family RNA polymerase sigma factor [Clostridia bacterium]|nr:sigma-70 family RNA polymerase sigma factor [Clostridia bacterium]
MQNIEEIYKKHSNTVYKYLFCLTGNEDTSEELTQETFAIAVKEIHKFKGNCKVSVWLCQIAKHLWYKELKKKSHKDISMEDISEEILSVEATEDVIIGNEEKLRLFKDMQMLDNKTREVLYLRMIGNLNFIEIGEILGKTPNWARVTFYRGKQKIREANKNGEKN